MKYSIIRHSPPNKMDHAPFGTSCKVVNEGDDTFELYTQWSSNSEEPKWQHMGTFQGDSTDGHICDQLLK